MARTIEAVEPFVGWRIYGPYKNQDTRQIVQLVRPDGTKTGMDYGRFLMCVKEGRLLERGEVVDHIDDNPSNNDLTNLQILTYSENRTKNKPKRAYVKFTCPCGKTFKRAANQRPSVKGYKRAYCSRQCSGKYGRRSSSSHPRG